MVLKDVEDVVAHILKLLLDLLAVCADLPNTVAFGVLGLLLLLDRGDYAPGGTAGTNDVLEGDGEQVALVDTQGASGVLRGVVNIK